MKNPAYRLVLVVVALFPQMLFGQAEEGNKFQEFWKKNVRTSIVSQLFTAYEADDRKFQMLKLTTRPELRVKLHKNLRFTGIARLQGDLLDHLEPGFPTQDGVSRASKRWLVGDRFEFELREFYVDWYVGSRSTLRLGKQQIVWGETDGLKLLDVVNPQNFREFILEDFDESRIPQWSVKAEFPLKGLNVELVWIPDMSAHDLPGLASSFFPSALIPRMPENVAIHMLPTRKPNRIIADSDIGTKISAFVNGWDLTLNYLYHYDDLPVLFRKTGVTPEGTPSISVQPQYRRMHTLGGTFNNALGPITLRGELAYHIHRHFMTAAENSDGTVRSDQVMFALGADWLFNETMLSVQSFHDILMSDVGAYNRRRYESHVSFLASQELFNDILKLELLLVHNLNHWDGMIRPKVSYYAQSNLKIMAGSDIFYGSNKGLFGQFRNRGRIFVGVEWGL